MEEAAGEPGLGGLREKGFRGQPGGAALPVAPPAKSHGVPWRSGLWREGRVGKEWHVGLLEGECTGPSLSGAFRPAEGRLSGQIDRIFTSSVLMDQNELILFMAFHWTSGLCLPQCGGFGHSPSAWGDVQTISSPAALV